MTIPTAGRPVARSNDLIFRRLLDELVVYDRERHRAHFLNPVAAAIFESCDGRRSTPELAAAAAKRTGAPVSEEAVLVALDKLDRRRLLTERLSPALRRSGPTRRELLARLGTAAAIPIVTSIVAPTAAHAGTCRPTGAACTTGAQCCSGVCAGTICV